MSTHAHVGQDSAMELLANQPEGHDAPGHHHPHPPHLAHHFDTPEQQYTTGKIGMWVFLGTEILMFGGLFCAYAVYRYNYPEIFLYSANHYLSTGWGALNTIILLASSLTMAMAVRYAQLDKQRALVTCLLLTLVGGAGFMCIKGIEYRDKYHHHVFLGSANNAYSKDYKGPEAKLKTTQDAAGAPAVAPVPTTNAPKTDVPAPRATVSRPNPHAGTSDDPAIKPQFTAPAGLVLEQTHADAHAIAFESMPVMAKERVYSFFQIYFLMTGLHGIHVIVGMGLIFWVTVRSVAPRRRPALLGLVPILIGGYVVFVGVITAHDWHHVINATTIVGAVILVLGLVVTAIGVGIGRKRPALATGDFSSDYFTPVDLVGLYWHLVDLIWIFLFPLLYLIH